MNDATPLARSHGPAAADPAAAADRIGAVVIGRNEGARLEACLASLRGRVGRMVYVDSGSTDGSVAAARRLGAAVVELDRDQPFTAARARNAGLAAFADGDPPEYLQFVDGDCTVDAAWIDVATRFLDAHPRAAVVMRAAPGAVSGGLGLQPALRLGVGHADRTGQARVAATR